jgi:hypothetical protein
MKAKHMRSLLVIFACIAAAGCPQATEYPREPVIEPPPPSEIQAQIEKVFANSKAGAGRQDGEEMHYYPVADTYAQGGVNKDTNYGGEAAIVYKGSVYGTDSMRKIFLRFDISGFTAPSAGGAFLELYCDFLQNDTAHEAAVLAVSDTAWTETGLTWENMPAAGPVLNRAEITAKGEKVRFDLTAFVNARLLSGGKIFSLSIQDTANREIRTDFSSRESLNPPVLRMVLSAAGGGRLPDIPANSDYDYITVPLNKREQPYTNYTDTQTRALSSLRNFIPSASAPSLGTYGGDISRPDTPTGFFYVKKDGNGRWWMIDPDGFRMLNIGIVAFTYGITPNERAGQQTVYGDNDAWALQAAAHIKNGLGFNGLGAWSKDETVMRNNPTPYTKLIPFLAEYAKPAGFVNDVLPVFDPAFETFAETRAASTVAALKDDKYLIGYFSDNELPAITFLLDRYLAIGENDEPGRFSRAVAWEWLRRRYGQDAAAAAVNTRDRDDFREFVYDYYAQVVSAAIRRHDPNHLYLGSRIHAEAKTSPGIWRALGRYCEAIAFNHYLMWEPSLAALADWEAWSGRPVLISEFYTKAMDSGLANTSGAGWIVPAQNDRGLFYEQFVLALIESGSCVGWHWFRYLDNDPADTAADPSNIDGNKGIIKTNFEEYTPLTSRMKTVNINVYRLVDYFAGRNGR